MASLSNSGLAHPPRSNPGSRSGCRPPFPCITPSTETCVVVVSFMMAVPFSVGTPLAGGLSPLQRTPLPRSDTAPGFLRGQSGTSAASDPAARRFRGDCAPLPQARVQCGRALGPDRPRCGTTGPAAARTGTRPTSSPPTSPVPPGNPRAPGTLPPDGHGCQAAAHSRNQSPTATSNRSVARRSALLPAQQPQGGAGDHDRDGGRDRGDQPGRGCRVVGLWRGGRGSGGRGRGGRGRGGRDGGRGTGGGRERGAGRYAQPGQGGGQLRGAAEPSGGL